MRSPSLAPLTRRGLLGLLAIAGCLAGTPAFAAPTLVQAQEVPALTSNAERIISYRHQEHMWQTADGTLHVMINRGTLQPDPGLQLYSSVDNGANWTLAASIPGTDNNSTSDGALVGNTLSLVYGTPDGKVLFQALKYDDASKTWAAGSTQLVSTLANTTGENPAVAIDAMGNAWVGYVAKNLTTQNYMIRVARRANNTSTWADVGVQFDTPSPDTGSGPQRSARPLPIAGGVGMMYAVGDVMKWIEHDNAAPASVWSAVTFSFTRNSDGDGGQDPYSSHFNMAGDPAGNLYMAVVSSKNVVFFRRTLDGGWQPPKVLTQKGSTAYCQVSVVDGSKVQVSYNLGGSTAMTQVSTDGGLNFPADAGYKLQHDNLGSGALYNYNFARLETPSQVTSPAPLLQQYKFGKTQRVMLFQQQ